MPSPCLVHLNGRIVPAEEATVSVSDAGFLHGTSAFTTMLARGGVVFRLERHVARLLATVQRLGLRADATGEGLAAAVAELLRAGGLADARVRITLTPGSVHDGKPTTLITAEPLPAYPPEWYERGITVAISRFRQAGADPTCGNKTGCYLPRVLALRQAAGLGADEAVWFTLDGRLAEACFCNVFLVLGGKVLTPGLDTPVLPGIVREAVIEICRRDGTDCDDRGVLTVHEMLAAEEMFLTASCSGVRPVVRIERHAVGDETPGGTTRRIMAAYERLVSTECRPKGQRRR